MSLWNALLSGVIRVMGDHGNTVLHVSGLCRLLPIWVFSRELPGIQSPTSKEEALKAVDMAIIASDDFDLQESQANPEGFG